MEKSEPQDEAKQRKNPQNPVPQITTQKEMKQINSKTFIKIKVPELCIFINKCIFQ